MIALELTGMSLSITSGGLIKSMPRLGYILVLATGAFGFPTNGGFPLSWITERIACILCMHLGEGRFFTHPTALMHLRK